jgi:hypothetical protein
MFHAWNTAGIAPRAARVATTTRSHEARRTVTASASRRHERCNSTRRDGSPGCIAGQRSQPIPSSDKARDLDLRRDGPDCLHQRPLGRVHLQQQSLPPANAQAASNIVCSLFLIG